MEEHFSHLGTEEQCYNYLVKIRWNGTPICPNCGNTHLNYFIKTRKIHKCAKCYKQFSVIKGTFMEGSKLSLKKWFDAIYLFTTLKKGISSPQLASKIGVPQKTAWLMLQKIRRVLDDDNNIILNGEVESDELFIFPKTKFDRRLRARKYKHEAEQNAIHGLTHRKRISKYGLSKRGRKLGVNKEMIAQKKIEKQLKGKRVPFDTGSVILGMAQREGDIVLKLLGPHRTSVNHGTVIPILEKHIGANSILITDEAQIYEATEKMFKKHYVIRHAIEVVSEDGTIHTNNIENCWKHLRIVVRGIYFHISYYHFQKYLNEHTFRWNNRELPDKEKLELFMNKVVGKNNTYRQIITQEEKLAA